MEEKKWAEPDKLVRLERDGLSLANWSDWRIPHKTGDRTGAQRCLLPKSDPLLSLATSIDAASSLTTSLSLTLVFSDSLVCSSSACSVSDYLTSFSRISILNSKLAIFFTKMFHFIISLFPFYQSFLIIF